MKKYVLDGKESMSKTEIKPISVQVLDLQEDETVSSANVTHTPPSGTALTITATVELSGGYYYANMEFGPFTVPGWHYVKVQAVGSDGSKPEVEYMIRVKDI